MIKIEIDARDLEDVRKSLLQYPEATGRALPRAINKTLSWANSQGLRAIAQKHEVPLKTLRGRRRSKVIKASRSRLSGLAWFGTAPLRASYLGTPRQTRQGARAGTRFFPGAFVATMPSGHVGIFKRQDRARLPIVEQVVRLDAADKALAPVEAGIAARLQTTFTQEMNYELNVRGNLR